MLDDFAYEGEKRKTFTYELERTRIETKAKTSIERAQNFLREIMKLLK